jgi:hypothetical protein
MLTNNKNPIALQDTEPEKKMIIDELNRPGNKNPDKTLFKRLSVGFFSIE